MRVPVLAVVAISWLSCTPSFPLPAGAQLSCSQGEACPESLLCDPELKLCVSAIVPTPSLTLTVDQAEGTRNTAFTFTASSPDAPLRFRWEVLDDTTGAATVLIEDGPPTLIHRFSSYGPSEFCQGDAGCRSALARTVRVTATNEGGKQAQRQTSVVIANRAPLADFGEDLFISEDGVPEVELDLCGGVRVDGGCTTKDLDGDPLEFSGFRLAGDAGLELRDAGPGRVRFTPPSNWQRPLVFTGVVSDRIEASVGTVRVFRGSHGWVNAGLLQQSWRLHPDFRAATQWSQPSGSALFHSPEALVSDGTGGWWFADSLDDGAFTGQTIAVHLDRNLNELERWAEPNSSHSFTEAVPALVPPRGSVPGCMAYRRFTSTGAFDAQSGFVRFTPGPGQTTLKHTRPPTTTGGVRAPLAVLPVGATTDCWAIGQGPDGAPNVNAAGGEIGKLAADATWTPIATLAGFPHASASEADGTLWIAERFPVPLPDGGFAPPVFNRFRTELRRFSPAGVSSTIDVGAHFFTQIAAHPSGGLWALDATDRSLVRVWPDGTQTRASTPPISGASVFAQPGLAVDPLGGAVWVTDAFADQLYRFEEAPDGGLTVSAVIETEDLPEGVNRRGFTRRIAVDPLTGSASSFVGAASSLYARWVIVPPHGRRLDRSAIALLEPRNVRGDPASGHAWTSYSAGVQRFDAQGRLLVDVANTWTSGQFAPLPAPFFVDRRGRAWVASTEGSPALRVLETDGREAMRVALPFNPTFLALAGTMQTNGPREVGCALSPEGGLLRLELGANTQQPLTVPPLPDAGVLKPFLCAPTSAGRLWVLANQPPASNPLASAAADEHFGLLYEAGVTTPGLMTAVRTRQAPMEGVIQITGGAAEESSGDLYFVTWDLLSYASELLRVSPAGNVTLVRQLQGPSTAGIGLGVSPRRVCPGPVRTCVELWVPNRLLEVHRYDAQGTDIESFVFGHQEPQLDLVQ